MTFTSYAQNFEDVMLWRALKRFSPGLYVDLGAQDPIVDSVSKAFYDAGWRGIHVEPSPFYAAALRDVFTEDKVIEAAVTNKAGSISFYEVAEGGLSTARADIAQFHHEHAGHDPVERKVAAITLAQIFNDISDKSIHWLKIDVEGLEREVLEGWGDSSQRPWIVVIESTFPTTDREIYHEWEGLITSKGYELVYTDGLNRFYLHHSQSLLRNDFRYPPNVFDDFELSGTSTSLTVGLVRRHEAELAERSSHIHTLDMAMKEVSTERDSLKAVIKSQKVQQQLDQVRTATELQRLSEAEGTASRAWALADASQAEISRLAEERATAVRSLAVSQGEASELASLLDDQRRQTAGWQAMYEKQFQAVVDATYARRNAEEWARAAREEVSKFSSEIDSQAEQIARLREALECALRENEEVGARLTRIAGTFLVRLLVRMRLVNLETHISPTAFSVASQLLGEVSPSFDMGKLQAEYEDKNRMAEVVPIHVNEILMANGSAFIDLAYRAILRRAPDRAGREHYMERLRDGDSKERVIVAIAKSPEARALPCHLKGMDELYARNVRKLMQWSDIRQFERSINRMEFSFGEIQARTQSRVDKILDRLETIEASLGSSLALAPAPYAGNSLASGSHKIMGSPMRRPVKDTVSEVTAISPREFVGELCNAVRQSSEATTFAHVMRRPTGA